jgi:molybdate transport system regulatory protein
MSRAKTVRPRVKVWLEADGDSVLCRGLSDILRAVDETGSIKSGAAKVGRSYRFVWARIKEAETAFGSSLVESRVGGREAKRSELTPLARDLLNVFDEMCAKVYQLVDGRFAEQVKETLRRHSHQP